MEILELEDALTPASVVSCGRSFPLAHLAPVEWLVAVPLRGGFTAKILVEVRFMNHCYTRSIQEDDVVPVEEIFIEGPADKRRNRVFCPIRYQFSFQLMRHIEELVQKRGRVFPAKRQNFFSVEHAELTHHPAGRATCLIFMSITKKKAPNTRPRLVLKVQSAYPSKPSIPSPVTKNGVSFLRLLGDAWVG